MFTDMTSLMEQMQDMYKKFESAQTLTRASADFYKTFFSKTYKPRQAAGHLGIYDPLVIKNTWEKAQNYFHQTYQDDPKRFEDLGKMYRENLSDLWQQTLSKLQGDTTQEEKAPPSFFSNRSDRRFKSQAWQENPIFDYLRQSYLINAELLQKTVESLDNIDSDTKRKLSFYTKQLVDSFSPSNFAWTNPDVIEETFKTQGENILNGIQNYMEDIKTGNWRAKAANEGVFEVGKNLACTPGNVVYQNNIFQLIHYTPTQSMAHEIPLLVIPPWINKFYILDLQEHNSFVKWCLDQGLNVFLISWVNPTKEHKNECLHSYLHNGALKAIEEILSKTNSQALNVLGYCTGGILGVLSELFLKQTKQDVIKSLTLLASPFDFSKAEELLTYVCEDQLRQLDEYLNENGVLEGNAMVQAFNLLRSNDLIWSYYVNSYLMGKDPMPFDMLYWNGDSLHLPARLHQVYLREIVYKNILLNPKGFSIEGDVFDMSHLTKPIYLMAAKDDHIAPWKSVVALKDYLKNKKLRFCLSSSGHVAGVMNHPSKGKYEYWIQEENSPNCNHENWLSGASSNPGSWWNDWKLWISSKSGSLKIPYKPKSSEILEEAPGSYVKVKN